MEEDKQDKLFQRKKILIVDDEFGQRESIRMIVKYHGATAVTANDGNEALKILDTDSFDLITTCLHLPGLNGIDFIKEIRARGLSTPIIVITGFGSLGTITTASQLGVYDYISKPFKVDNLISVFNKALDLKLCQGKENIEEPTKVSVPENPLEKLDPAIYEKAKPHFKVLYDDAMAKNIPGSQFFAQVKERFSGGTVDVLPYLKYFWKEQLAIEKVQKLLEREQITLTDRVATQLEAEIDEAITPCQNISALDATPTNKTDIIICNEKLSDKIVRGIVMVFWWATVASFVGMMLVYMWPLLIVCLCGYGIQQLFFKDRK